MKRVARFLYGYARHERAGVSVSDLELTTSAGLFPATLLTPRARGPLPAWILLHGVTVSGREHPLLTRFATAVAASGAIVIIPEIRAWRELRLVESAGNGAISAAVDFLRSRSDAAESISLAGFSFAATQALISAGRPGIREHIQRVVAFGGYCDLGRTLRGMMTGEHEWNGRRYRYEPDPYGRWVVAANYLEAVPEYAHMTALREAALDLAMESGRRGVFAADAEYDQLKRQLRRELSSDERELWDVIAPPHDQAALPETTRALTDRIVTVATDSSPDLDPRPILPLLDQEIILAHGREDRLIPFTETLRLAAALPGNANVSATITRLFVHSREADRLSPLVWPREAARYLRLLRRALNGP